jgi:hypothetical protein
VRDDIEGRVGELRSLLQIPSSSDGIIRPRAYEDGGEGGLEGFLSVESRALSLPLDNFVGLGYEMIR